MEMNRVRVSDKVRDLPHLDVAVGWRLGRGIHVGPAKPVTPVVGGDVGAQQMDQSAKGIKGLVKGQRPDEHSRRS